MGPLFVLMAMTVHAATSTPPAISIIDAATLPTATKSHTSAQWTALASAAPDNGIRSILSEMSGGVQPQLTVKLEDGNTLAGSAVGLTDDKIAFQSDAGLMGLDRRANSIVEVRRKADVLFDGGRSVPEEIVVYAKPPAINNPYKDIASYLGQYVEIEARQLDDLKHSATVFGKILAADGETIELEQDDKQVDYLKPKRTVTLHRDFHRIDAIRRRAAHYDSKKSASFLDKANDYILPGTPVEMADRSSKSVVTGLFYGARSAQGDHYILLDVLSADGTRKMRAFSVSTVAWVRTQGYQAGEFVPGSTLLYAAPNAAK